MKLSPAYLLVIITFWCLNTTAQQLFPPIQNYTSVEYHAASQNWDISLDENGIIYSANNQGLLSYDGQRWELFQQKSGAIIRSVYVKGNRIYTGSYRDFGYWSRDAKGRMDYTSLVPAALKAEMQSEEFWGILPYKDAIYFRSFGSIYKLEGEQVKLVKKIVSNKMTVYKDKLLLALSKEGLCFLNEKGEFLPLPHQEILKGKVVEDMLVVGDKLLVGTRDGLYQFDGTKFRLFPDERLLKELKGAEFNRMMALSSDELVIGTVKNGIIDYRISEKNYRIYDRNSGLQNNTVLGMAKRDGKIWLGLDNGIDEIGLTSSVHYYTDKTGELGSVYDLAFQEGQLYLASNTGAYTFRNDKLQVVKGSRGHTWNLAQIDHELYVSHNTGTYKVRNDEFVPIEKRTGSFQVLPVYDDPKVLLVGTYTGISTYKPASGEIRRIGGLDFPVKKMIFEDPHTIWAAHPYEGTYRIKLGDDLKNAVSVKKISAINGNGNFKGGLYKINNQIAVLEKGKWYRYNSFQDSLEVFKELKDLENFKLLYEGNDQFWFVNTKNNSLYFTDFDKEEVTISHSVLNDRLVKGNENIVKANDSTFFVTLKDGFATVNIHRLLAENENQKIPEPILLGVKDSDASYALDSRPEIPYQQATEVKFRAALPGSEASVLKYELTGAGNQKGEVTNGIIKFQNLTDGDYILKLFAVGPQKNTSGIRSFKFMVAPPWYLSAPMKLIYVILILSAIWFLYWFNKRKLARHQQALEEKFEKEHQERLNQIEKERLLNEINLKRKELANTTMLAAKKNEVLMEIQGELNKDKEKFSNQFRIKHIMSKINKAIKDKDEWKVFETNFNELHEDFFRDLLEKYPKLTNKDLKLCSYLRMNLTTKEIAPLMGISVRGVEVHRYRLRKKMELDKKENLGKFLIKNF